MDGEVQHVQRGYSAEYWVEPYIKFESEPDETGDAELKGVYVLRLDDEGKASMLQTEVSRTLYYDYDPLLTKKFADIAKAFEGDEWLIEEKGDDEDDE